MKLRTLLAAVAVLFLLGCGDEAPPPPPKAHNYTLEVDVTDSQGNVLPSVAVTVDEKTVGYTDADGKFSAVLSEYAGASITLGVIAPTGYHFPPDTDTVTEVLKTTNVHGQVSGVPVFLSAMAESLEKDYFIWVKAACDNGCKDWPVLVNGEEKARTNALGYAHFSFTDQPHNDIEVEIVTAGANKPANPKYSITLERDSTLYRIEQPFADPAKPKRVVRAPRAKGKGKGKGKGKDAAKVPAPGDFVDPTPKKVEGVIDLFGN